MDILNLQNNIVGLMRNPTLSQHDFHLIWDIDGNILFLVNFSNLV